MEAITEAGIWPGRECSRLRTCRRATSDSVVGGARRIIPLRTSSAVVQKSCRLQKQSRQPSDRLKPGPPRGGVRASTYGAAQVWQSLDPTAAARRVADSNRLRCWPRTGRAELLVCFKQPLVGAAAVVETRQTHLESCPRRPHHCCATWACQVCAAELAKRVCGCRQPVRSV